VPVPLTGKGAEWGQGAKPAIDIAVEEINAKGGIGGLPIEMICYDDQTLELKRSSNEPPCRRDKVLAVVGPCFSGRSRRSRRNSTNDSRRRSILLLCQARPLRDEQVGVPQHAHQRQAAHARRQGLA
jgi:hypothetical protein